MTDTEVMGALAVGLSRSIAVGHHHLSGQDRGDPVFNAGVPLPSLLPGDVSDAFRKTYVTIVNAAAAGA